MPAPFPGMDPYLEGSEWTSVHAELSSEIAHQLAPQLQPKYIVRPARRIITESLGELAITPPNSYPDVTVSEAAPHTDASVAVIAPTLAPLRIATVMPARVPQISIEIRDVANRDLVTAIEVLSPTNKRGEGYKEYLDKRGRILLSPAHLIEIDLLRSGRRVPMQQPLPPTPYFVFVGRAERRPIVDVWPIRLQDRLPIIPAPLLGGDPDVTFDLQLALTTIYDTLRYDLSVDYTRPPEVPLAGPDADWTATLLRNAGIVP